MGGSEWLFGVLIISNSKWVNNMASLLAVYQQPCMYIAGIWICGKYVNAFTDVIMNFCTGYDSISEVEITLWVEYG